ncbi:glycine-rich cell wall structural protein 1 precursor, putative [Perkinsus marinus ATCC 50983]|uniref:Glycine-rich cell wall structural protein 1, putative n=1 Tax=Perkinsus marinus (strain ATCC 50983 / TXsc) TaxID=423536 RepID=C5L9E9_PERM5|nr:glycine-rich cell wall structural protein 1 precursor, putative [Perkinsus marinus ATCC 50983]EER06630.1 glycine-rich cell wall structural protein 1 precursor, putative [Perkinsus marinus ATCC 50983]|eukprot:XP_002774814.1 glycine-rich cell wall structural protein 1 precursor, putative [Perkinsus marinus ATCC 50983]
MVTANLKGPLVGKKDEFDVRGRDDIIGKEKIRSLSTSDDDSVENFPRKGKGKGSSQYGKGKGWRGHWHGTGFYVKGGPMRKGKGKGRFDGIDSGKGKTVSESGSEEVIQRRGKGRLYALGKGKGRQDEQDFGGKGKGKGYRDYYKGGKGYKGKGFIPSWKGKGKGMRYDSDSEGADGCVGGKGKGYWVFVPAKGKGWGKGVYGKARKGKGIMGRGYWYGDYERD